MPSWTLGFPNMISEKTKRKVMRKHDYCPYCRVVREVIKDDDELLCKTCGKRSKVLNPNNLLLR